MATSFFTFFSLAAVLVGFLVNRTPTKWIIAAMVLVWSICQMPLMLTTTFGALIASRMLLGLAKRGGLADRLPRAVANRAARRFLIQLARPKGFEPLTPGVEPSLLCQPARLRVSLSVL